jgi:putative ABC transport system permease protein
VNAFHVILRSARHHARTHTVIAAGIAVAAAVLSGSLLVGDSIHASVRRVILGRLGGVQAALVAPTFFREALATDLLATLATKGPAQEIQLIPIVHVKGPVRREGALAMEPEVAVVGVDGTFWTLFPGAAPLVEGRTAAISQGLAQALDVREGDTILVHVGRGGSVPQDTLFARKAKADSIRRLRLTVGTVLPAGGAGEFALEPRAAAARNVFVDRAFLTGRAYLDRRNQINGLLASGPAADAETLSAALRACIRLPDLEFQVRTNAAFGYVAVQSESLVLRPHQRRAAEAAAAAVGGGVARTSVYMANALTREAPATHAAHYLTIAAGDALAPLPLAAGEGASPAPGTIWLTAWTAADLEATVGDRIEVRWFLPEGADEEVSDHFRVSGIVALEGPALDRGVVPEFQGITEFDRMEDWDPPFAFDRTRISKRDDAWWEQYRATPKAWLALEDLRQIWQGRRTEPREDWLTSLRIAPPPDEAPDVFAPRLERALLDAADPAEAGLVFRDVRAGAIEAARGTMNFGSLFASMSGFLVMAAVGLAAMTARLALLQRARGVGLLLTLGFPRARVRRWLLAETLVVAVAGVGLGVALALGYADLLVRALQTRWAGAIAHTPIALTVTPGALLGGAIGTWCVVAGALWWAFRALRKPRVLDLLGGWQSAELHAAQGRNVAGPVAVGAAALALALVACASLFGAPPPQWAFMGAGVLLLTAGLAGGAAHLRRSLRVRAHTLTPGVLAARNAAANRDRSLLAMGLLAAASFIIVAVAVNRRAYDGEKLRARDSGTGGFALRALTTLPLPYDLTTAGGRAKLGFTADDESLFAATEIHILAMSGGDDISCLNLARPAAPRVLGVPHAFVARGGFRFARTEAPRDDAWRQLSTPRPDGSVPTIGDAASVQWSLHSGLGQTIPLPLDTGGVAALRCVGMLAESIFQSELLVGEAAFRTLFPGGGAGQYVLLAPPVALERDVERRLREVLGDWGVQVQTTRELLQAFIEVQNTYLAMFLILGGLGLLMGTLGLVAVLFRNAFERRRELAMLLAMGFGRSRVASLLVRENLGLLLAGIGCGAGAALVAFIPHLVSVEAHVDWTALLAVLALIYATGDVATRLTARAAVTGRLLDAIRGE